MAQGAETKTDSHREGFKSHEVMLVMIIATKRRLEKLLLPFVWPRAFYGLFLCFSITAQSWTLRAANLENLHLAVKWYVLAGSAGNSTKPNFTFYFAFGWYAVFF